MAKKKTTKPAPVKKKAAKKTVKQPDVPKAEPKEETKPAEAVAESGEVAFHTPSVAIVNQTKLEK